MTIVQGTTEDRARVLTRRALRLLTLANKRKDAMPADAPLALHCNATETIWDIEDILEGLDTIRFGPIREVLTVHDPKQDAIRSATSILRRLLPSLD